MGSIHFESIREIFFQFYQEHFLASEYNINSMMLYNNTEKTSEFKKLFTLDEIKPCIVETNYHHNKWLINLVKDFPFFKELNDHDLSTMIYHGQIATYSFKLTQFIKNDESYAVLENNVWFSRSVIECLVGKATAEALFRNHNVIRSLNLTIKEKALIFPYLLSQCDGIKNEMFFVQLLIIIYSLKASIIENKEKFQNLKNYYTKALVFELQMNRRNSLFIEALVAVSMKKMMIYYSGTLLILELKSGTVLLQCKIPLTSDLPK